MLLKAVEDALVGMKPGERKTFDIPPEQAFGPRDPAKVKTIPLRRFRDVEGPVRVGDVVSVEGRQGVVRSIGGVAGAESLFRRYVEGLPLTRLHPHQGVLNRLKQHSSPNHR